MVLNGCEINVFEKYISITTKLGPKTLISSSNEKLIKANYFEYYEITIIGQSTIGIEGVWPET